VFEEEEDENNESYCLVKPDPEFEVLLHLFKSFYEENFTIGKLKLVKLSK
jgi:hypothetical protein